MLSSSSESTSRKPLDGSWRNRRDMSEGSSWRGGNTASRGSWRGGRAQYQRGGWVGGSSGAATSWRGGRSNRHGEPSHSRLVCEFFQRGRCAYGESCKFEHPSRTPTDGVTTALSFSSLAPSQLESTARDHYLTFKRQVKRTSGNFVETWALAASVLDGPLRERHQAIARDLVDDDLGGPGFILHTIEACMDRHDQIPQLPLAEAFLKTITHKSLVTPLSIESYVSTIYRILGGFSGERGLACFRSILTIVSPKESNYTAILALIATGLRELLSREMRILLNDKLSSVLEMLGDSIDVIKDTSTSVELQVAKVQVKSIMRMEQVVRLRHSDPSVDPGTETRAVDPTRSTFPKSITIPGGNHDNDCPDITRIQIFPTLEEIQSDHVEFLPSTDFSEPHFYDDPVQRHIDTAFRLLRHDIFGPMKEALRPLTQGLHSKDAEAAFSAISSSLRAHLYSGATVEQLFIRPGSGLEAVLSFSPLPQLHSRSKAECRRWWKDSSRLQPGGLVCLVTSDDPHDPCMFMFVVTEKRVDDVKDEESELQSSLVSQRRNPSVSVKLVSRDERTLSLLSQAFITKRTGAVVDFPGIIPETFVPILKNLQHMMKDGHMPFSQWVLPSSKLNIAKRQETMDVPPPLYARKPWFSFDLSPIIPRAVDRLAFNPACPDDINLQRLEAITGLDEGQCQALIHALSREYALIQGPPGTGKSYVGVQLLRVLLEHKWSAALGPIIVICYTNHALDQFLKHLLHVGIESIIRIGGQCRTEELAGKNLRVVSRHEPKTSGESYHLGSSFGLIKEELDCAENYLHRIRMARRRRVDQKGISTYLAEYHPSIAAQLQGEDAEGFTLAGNDQIDVWLGREDNPWIRRQHGDEELDIVSLEQHAEHNVWSLGKQERWALAESWLSRIVNAANDHLFYHLDAVKDAEEAINSVHADVNSRILEEADVIGITTTGLAKNIAMLRGIGAKVVICEEAAEVMEPHLISAMMPGIEHLIQIGDHRQLRPQINNYGFSVETSRGKKFQLDRSQFERRAEGEPGLAPLPVAQLNVQRRMRPEISSLIRTVYPDLKDHDCVQNFPGVTGMREHLFWLDHQHPEDGRYDGAKVKSHSNSWEVSMSTALVRHLVRQGEYKSTDIALLTPYTGQLQKLRAALSGDFEVFLSDRDLEKLADDGFGHADGVESDSVDSVDDAPRVEHKRGRMLQKTALVNTIRLATVDNFQGEEAKVIIVSLVRSNSNNEIGFLRTENRVNVLLSRAQHGMYLIGNAKTYRGVNIWDDVYQQLAERGAVGDSIALCCPRHPDIPIVCSNPDDFLRRSPEGGCTLRCDQRLDPCGHRCPAMCHSQALHDVFSCSQPCPRIRTTCQHACPKLCGEDCGPCRVTVTDVELPCGHIADEVECCQTPHPETIRCLHPVTKIVPDCQHKVKVPCETDVSQYYHCPTPCEATLACGDRCAGKCGTCQHSHKECQRICRLPSSTCNHLCDKKCHTGELCGSCRQSCQVRCPHSSCPQPCHKPCAPCIEKCGWACEHMGQCSLPCAAPCDRLPCDKRCSRKLKCGHQCPSFCGEECPEDLCQLCCQDERRQRRVDVLEWKLYREVDLDDSPIIVLSCGHFFTGETLDGSLGMTQVYTTNSNGEYNGLRDITGTLFTSGVPSCPDCRIPIRQFATRRYNRVVNKAVMDETIKRFFVDGRRHLQELQQRLAAATAKDSLDNIPEWNDTVPGSGTSSVLRDRHLELHRINLALQKAKQQMDTEHQPAKKLFDAIVSSRRRRLKTLSMEQRLPELSLTGPPPAYNSQVLLEAEALHLQVRAAILQDKMRIAAKVPELQEGLKGADRPGTDVPELMKDCMEGIKKSREGKLPRLVISLSQLYAQTSQLAGRYSAQYRARTVEWRDYGATAGELLIEALQLCGTFEDGESFREDVQEALKDLKSTRYEKVSREEVKAIKLAMVSGFGGMSTNSGHWYNCQNGHPFAIGECGMPMEVARCPECGARIGGLDHELVDGVSRAEGME